jgi:hypothetical protein
MTSVFLPITFQFVYEAYYALRELFEPETDKRKIIDFLIAEDEEADKEKSQPIEF